MVRYLGNSAPQIIGIRVENSSGNVFMQAADSNLTFYYKTSPSAAATPIANFYYDGISRLAIYGTLTTTTLTSETIEATYFTAFSDIQVNNWHKGSRASVMDSTVTTVDVDIPTTYYITTSPVGYNLLDFKVMGTYSKNPSEPQKSSGVATGGVAGAANVSHLYKCFIQGLWANNNTQWGAEGGTVYASLNTDATNFPAGAINVAKVQIIANASAGAILRLTNRTTPASSSATYWAYSCEYLAY
jgi:hypothetical protein